MKTFTKSFVGSLALILAVALGVSVPNDAADAAPAPVVDMLVVSAVGDTSGFDNQSNGTPSKLIGKQVLKANEVTASQTWRLNPNNVAQCETAAGFKNSAGWLFKVMGPGGVEESTSGGANDAYIFDYNYPITKQTIITGIESVSRGCCYEFNNGALLPTFYSFVWGNCADPDVTHVIWKVRGSVKN